MLDAAHDDAPPALPLNQRRILHLLAKRPGVPFGEVAARLGIGCGTARHHLHRLERQGRVHTVVAGRRRLAFLGPPAPVAPPEVLALGLLRGRSARAVAGAIAARPHLRVLDVALALQESPRAVYYHVKQLREAGLLVSSSPRRYRDLAPSSHLVKLLAQLDATVA